MIIIVNIMHYRSGESLMAVIPLSNELKDSMIAPDETVRVPLFLVRIDGVIYNTGMYMQV